MNALYTCMEVRIRLLQWLLSKWGLCTLHLYKLQSHWFVHECTVYLYGSENPTAAMAALKVRAVHMTLTQSTVTLICSCLHRLQLHWFVRECIVYLYGSENQTAAVAAVNVRAVHITLTQSTVSLILSWMHCIPVWKWEPDCCNGCCQSKGCAHYTYLHRLQLHWFVHECIVYLYGSENPTAAMAAVKVRAVHMTLAQSTVTLICSHLHKLQLHWFVRECIVYLYGSENPTAAVYLYTCVRFKRNVWSLISILLLVLHTKCLKCKIAVGWSGLD